VAHASIPDGGLEYEPDVYMAAARAPIRITGAAGGREVTARLTILPKPDGPSGDQRTGHTIVFTLRQLECDPQYAARARDLGMDPAVGQPAQRVRAALRMAALEFLTETGGLGDVQQTAAGLPRAAANMDHPLMHLLEVDIQPARGRGGGPAAQRAPRQEGEADRARPPPATQPSARPPAQQAAHPPPAPPRQPAANREQLLIIPDSAAVTQLLDEVGCIDITIGEGHSPDLRISLVASRCISEEAALALTVGPI
jgi:hypothetical protein